MQCKITLVCSIIFISSYVYSCASHEPPRTRRVLVCLFCLFFSTAASVPPPGLCARRTARLTQKCLFTFAHKLQSCLRRFYEAFCAATCAPGRMLCTPPGSESDTASANASKGKIPDEMQDNR